MAIHPIEGRYGYKEMQSLFLEGHKMHRMADVEIALAKAHAKLGNIPKKDASEIEKRGHSIKLEEVKAIEDRIHHDVMAVVKAMSNACGTSGKYIHFGATSYDIVDTMWGLIFKDVLKILRNDLAGLKNILTKITKEHKNTLMVGRTHGQHALPITFGFKTANWLAEVIVHMERLNEIEKRLAVGKMSGAVGTFASFNTTELQKLVMKGLGLNEPRITTQVVARESYAEFLSCLAIVAGTIEKICREVRNLSRNEIMEVNESFDKEQVGSSTMPQKRNPHKSERLCGIARILRSNSIVGLENIALEHERDLTNSASERIVIPESCILADYMLRQMAEILQGLVVNKERMKQNLLSDEFVMAESIMLSLTRKGMGRQDAHELVRTAAMQAYKEGTSFKASLKTNGVLNHLSEKELEKAMNPESYLGRAHEAIERVLKQS